MHHTPDQPGGLGERLMHNGAIDLDKGGSAIPYRQDACIRQEFEATLPGAGVASRMEERFYQPSSGPPQLM